MKANVGSFDAGLRFVLGCFILGGALHGLGWWALIGPLLILSAALAFCPFYCILRIDTAEWERGFEQRHKH